MSQEVRAIYENGQFRPLDPVLLPEQGLVSLVISSPSSAEDAASGPRPIAGENRDRLMEQLLGATAHFRVGTHPTREEMNGR